MKKGEIYEGVVERIDFPNKGRVHVEGETVTVKNAIPGQKIRFQINKKRKNRMEGPTHQVTMEVSDSRYPSLRCIFCFNAFANS